MSWKTSPNFWLLPFKIWLLRGSEVNTRTGMPGGFQGRRTKLGTPSIPKIIWVKNVRAIVVCGFLMKSLKKHMLKIWKKSWVPFGRYLLNSTADSAQFEWKWAGLAVLFSRYLPNGTHDFFQIFSIYFFKDFIKNPQTTIALTFLTHIISGILDGVFNFKH